MILIVDNYDSFTFNLAQAIGSMGYEVLVLRNDAFELNYLDKTTFQAVVISPGPGEPLSAGMSMPVIGHLKKRLPVIGVCLGHQAVGAYFGGRVIRASRLMHGKTSRVYHRGDTLFHGVDSPFDAMRYHSLILERSTLPPDLQVIAETEEGEIMAIRHKKYPNLVGVQFHPESYFTPAGYRILSNFFCNSGDGIIPRKEVNEQ